MIATADRDFILQRQAFYARHLRDDVLPWWLENAIDEQHGGVFTYWDGAGDALTLRTTNKYVWSQGRWGWSTAMLARLGSARPDLDLDVVRLQRSTLATAELLYGALLPDGTSASIITREGEPLERNPGQGLHDSVYSDLFVSLAFSAAELVAGSGEWGQRALDLMTAAEARIRRGPVRSAPYPVPEGFESFALNMILLNTGAEVFAATGAAEAIEIAERAARALRHDFAVDGDMCELRPFGPALLDTLEARHRNPGHVLEGLWMYRQAADLMPEVAAIDPDCDKWLAEVFVHMCRLGWDSEEGGLLRFVDREGGPPRGTYRGSAYEDVVRGGWDWKLWWPHNEALYAALLIFQRTGDLEVGAWYRRLDEYAFSRFPAGPGREWKQILDRRGKPMAPDANAALPVKDPYHLLRGLMLLIELDPRLSP